MWRMQQPGADVADAVVTMYLRQQYALYNLTYTECLTCKEILAHANDNKIRGDLMLMPNHHFTRRGEFTGFRFTCKSSDSLSALPVSRELFRGSMLCECEFDSTDELELFICKMLQQRESTYTTLANVAKSLQSPERPARLSCIPENINATKTRMGESAAKLANIDVEDWDLSCPSEFGVYHAYVRSHNMSDIQRKVYVYCNAYCATASDETYNLKLDLQDHVDCATFTDSEELWWLRRANSRNRARICYLIADALGLRIRTTVDTCRLTPNYTLAIPTIETLEYDIKRDTKLADNVHVFAACADTTHLRNGLILRAAPHQGLYIIHGPARVGQMVYGGSFGDSDYCGVLPVLPAEFTTAHSAFDCNDPNYERHKSQKIKQARVIRRHVNPQQKEDSTVCVDGPVVFLGGKIDQDAFGYVQTYDEAFVSNLTQMQWNREYGITELYPLSVFVFPA